MSNGEEYPGAPDPYRTVAQMVPGQAILGRYTLTRILGRGGFGVVWEVHDNELDMDVAIKFLSDIIVSNPEAVDDLKRETKFSLRLTHPNIVRIYGFVQDATVAGISMEYIDGGTLSALKVKRPNRCFDVDTLAPLTERLCDALDYAHKRVKIAHRDLKPGNLMVDSSGDLKVADFGISRSISDTQTALTQVSSSGTPAFMSPQQMMGDPASHSDDIYSLGGTLYDLLAGKPPFYTGNIVEQVRTVAPVGIAVRRQELGIEASPVPPEWEEVIRACLEKEVENRPTSAAEVANRLGLRVSHASTIPVALSGESADGGGIPANATPPGSRIPTSPSGAPVSLQTSVVGSGTDPAAPSSPGTVAPTGANSMAGTLGASTEGLSVGTSPPGGAAPSPGMSSPGAAESTGRPGWILPVAVTVVAVLAVGVWWLNRPGSAELSSVDGRPDVASSSVSSLERGHRDNSRAGHPDGEAATRVGDARSSLPGSDSSGSSRDPDSGQGAQGQVPPGGDAFTRGGSEDGTPNGGSSSGATSNDSASERVASSRGEDAPGSEARLGSEHSHLPEASPGDNSALPINSSPVPGPGSSHPGDRVEPPEARASQIQNARGELEHSISRGHWDGAESGLAALRALSPDDSRIGNYEAQIADGREVQQLRRQIPDFLAAGRLETARTAISTLLRRRPGDRQATGWQKQLAVATNPTAAGSETSVPTAAGDRAAIESLLQNYEAALETVDFKRFVGLWSELSKKKRSKFEKAFKGVESQSIEVVGTPSISMDGDAATVELREKRRMTMSAGSDFNVEVNSLLSLVRIDGAWKIQDLEAR